MLSKSQARAFFLGGTAMFSLVFLGLTVDTLRQVPKQVNAAAITPEVAHGQHLWTKNNCMGCHTLMGEGAYYAPELTKVVERRGEEWIKVFLKDPAAMYPGQRKMVHYNFTETDINDLVAFFSWIGKADLNGFPRKPDLAVAATAAPTSTTQLPPAPAYYTSVCAGCHALGGKGGAVGPALDGVGSRLTAEQIDARLKDPKAVLADAKMPQLNLDAPTRQSLVQYLAGLR